MRFHTGFEAKPDFGAEIADFFKVGLPLVEAQPERAVWFAFRLNGTTYGAFAAFANEDWRSRPNPGAAVETGTRAGQPAISARASGNRSGLGRLLLGDDAG